MKLTIVIVNYNVKFFLEQCLHSVIQASKNCHTEVFVVDNNSADGSCSMVRDKFPGVKLIENKTNVGFSKANNQAIKVSTGEYVLLLNPDTVVEESTFEKIVQFMESHPDAGALGVKMIDGKGKFLPESKRALPTPGVAFYKVFGLARLFPKSSTFNKYHLGNLDNDSIHQVEVLSGAFMLLRRTVLDQVGLLDETFFMYGEDIDLSYRILLGGHKNYYFPDTTIIHYKGESTKRGSINYVLMFYNAMTIFARKHFSKKNASSFILLIKVAIYFRAFLAILQRVVHNFLVPALEVVSIFLGYYFVKPYWEAYKFPEGGGYPDEFLLIAVPVYILIWILSIFFSGGYYRPFKLFSPIKGIAIGTGIILIIYALLSEDVRFSRALILLGSVWAIAITVSIRGLLHLTGLSGFRIFQKKIKRILIVGGQKEANRIYDILKKSSQKQDIRGIVSPDEKSAFKETIGVVGQLVEIVRVNRINEVIFSAKDVSAQEIIRSMLQQYPNELDYKIASPDSVSIIGSNSMNSTGDLYTVHINSISNPDNQRNKRLLDVVITLLGFLIFPILIFVVINPLGFFKNCLNVLIGRKTWVGYSKENSLERILPSLRQGVLSPLDNQFRVQYADSKQINMDYAKNYRIITDSKIIIMNIKNLGRL